jgi:hypothetical protein
VVQIVIGFINLGLLALVYMQLIYLFMADSVWVVFVLFGAQQLESSSST